MRTALLVLTLCTLVACQRSDPAAPIDGSSAQQASPSPPAFPTLPLLSGGTFSLDDYRGRMVLLNFWATWCAPCREEIPDLIALRNEFSDQGFEVIGIAMDLEGRDVVAPFAAQFGIPYPIVLGTQEAADAVGGILGLPTSLLLDADGNLVRRFSGLFPTDEVRPFLRESLAGSHSSQVGASPSDRLRK